MRNLDYHTLQINPESLQHPGARETCLASREELSCREKKVHSAPRSLCQSANASSGKSSCASALKILSWNCVGVCKIMLG